MAGKRRHRRVRRWQGYTLIELLLGLGLVATTLAWGVPSFRTLSLDAARTREVNQFAQAVYLARSEAIKRNGVVSLCPSRNGSTLLPKRAMDHRVADLRQPGPRLPGGARCRRARAACL